MTEVRALSGRPVEELTLEAVRQGEIGLEDLRIHPETLERQATIAEEHGNPQLAENLRRAAELTRLGDDEVLAIYAALRPGRATPAVFEVNGRQFVAIALGGVGGGGRGAAAGAAAAAPTNGKYIAFALPR